MFQARKIWRTVPKSLPPPKPAAGEKFLEPPSENSSPPPLPQSFASPPSPSPEKMRPTESGVSV